MNQNEIIAMAKEAGFGMQMALLDHPYCQADAQRLYQQLERFAALVAAKERERFALECIDLVAFHGGSVELEAAIRARGTKEGA